MQIIRAILQRLQEILEKTFPNWSHKRQRQKWERQWSNPNYRPFWKTENTQKELVEAVQSNWFPQGSLVIDVGCGNGEVSRWLADRNFPVLGLDYSASAIENCRAKSKERNDGATFQVADLCDAQFEAQPASSLVDRGCFHRIAENFRPAFARNVAKMTAPEGHFLLLAATFQRAGFGHDRNARSEQELGQHVESLFGSFFAIQRAEPAVITANEGEDPMPAVAFWMIRNQTAVA